MPDGRLAGRRALVTGAGSGIGAAIAEAYVREGAAVCLNDRDGARAAEVAARCGAAAVAVGDVGDEDGSRGVVDEAARELGGIDVLVNNAGMLTEVAVEAMDVPTWDEMLRVDLRSVFLCTRWALPGMLDRGWGRVVNVASQLAIKGGVGLAHYSAAKAGVLGFTKSLAQEVAGRGVLVNAIAPGPIETPLVAGISAEWKARKQAELPLGRFGRAEEVAPTAVLLASDPDGNLYVGQTLGPNSGDVMP
jgi:3-oxoacyl-[acyl-carrier protein] reductase